MEYLVPSILPSDNQASLLHSIFMRAFFGVRSYPVFISDWDVIGFLVGLGIAWALAHAIWSWYLFLTRSDTEEYIEEVKHGN